MEKLEGGEGGERQIDTGTFALRLIGSIHLGCNQRFLVSSHLFLCRHSNIQRHSDCSARRPRTAAGTPSDAPGGTVRSAWSGAVPGAVGGRLRRGRGPPWAGGRAADRRDVGLRFRRRLLPLMNRIIAGLLHRFIELSASVWDSSRDSFGDSWPARAPPTRRMLIPSSLNANRWLL